MWLTSQFAVGDQFTFADILVSVIFNKCVALGIDSAALPLFEEHWSALKLKPSSAGRDKYEDFWQEAKSKVSVFKKLDDHLLIFGAGYHNYNTLPVLTERNVRAIEKIKMLDLPLDFRSYLKTYGTGGAGPGTGVVNLAERLEQTEFRKPFKCPTLGDEASVDFSGLLYLGTAVILPHDSRTRSIAYSAPI